MPINNMFSTWFNTWFGSWFSIWGNNIQSITKQQKYPWLNAEQVKRLEASVNGLTWTAKTQQLQKNYRAMIQIINDQNINDNRTAVNNERFKNSLNKKDARECRFDQSACRQSDLVDLVKSVKWLKASTDENTVMTKLMQEMSIRGVEMDSLNNYLDKGDETFLYEMGLAQQPQQSNALSIKWTVADNEWGEWNDNLFGRFETEQYDKNASLGENALTFGKNLLKSWVNVLSDVWNMIVNPLDTVNALWKTAVGGVANLLWVDEDMAQWGDRWSSANDTADQVWQFFKERYWGDEWEWFDYKNALNTLFTDPVGVISDAATLISWWAGAVKGITTWAAKATAKAWLKGTTRALERTSNTAWKIAKAWLEYDPYSVAMKLEMKPISATIDYAKKVPWASKIMKEKLNEALDKTVWLDKLTKKAIQDNPFSKEVWQKAKTWIDANWLPEKSTEVSKQLITDVSEKVQNAVAKEMEKLWDTWPMYQPLKEAWFSVDLTNLKNWGLDEILTDYGIKIEDWKLDFSKSAIDGSEASNIKKIYDRVQDTNSPMPMNEYIDRFRKTISDMVNFNTNNKNALWKKLADTPWDKVLKSIRERANELAHEQVPALKDLDSAFTKQSELVKEITEWIVYKDKAKMWVVRDNIDQIVKNLDTNNRAQLKARLEKIIPWIEQEVKAINMLPKLIDNYYRPSKLQQKISGTAWAIIWTTVGWIPWWLLWAWAWYWLSNKIDKLKSRKRDKIISETSKDWADKLADIQNRIANNEKISQAQKAFLKEISQKLKEWKQVKEWEVMKIISDIMSAEEWKELAVLDKAISELETLWAKDEVKEWKKFREDMIWKMNEEAEMNRYAEEFEAEKQNIINESADQRLPEFKRRIYQLWQEERRIWSVAWKKIWKNFEGKDYHRQQQTEWLRKKEAVIKEIQDYYNVDQFEASNIFDRIERQASADDLGFSGKPASSKTAKYQVADQTNTPEFKKWFEWSKVVDESWKPLRVYHWTPENFTEFKKDMIWANYWQDNQWFFFTNDKAVAQDYADTTSYWIPRSEKWNVMEVYLDIKNPLIKKVDFDPIDLWDNNYEKFLNEANKNWNDWIIIKADKWQSMYVPFEPNQIKSATDNIWTFDKNNPDIRYQKYWVAWQWERGISAAEWLNIRNFKNWKSVKELSNQYWIDTKIVDSISTPEWQKAYWMYWDRLITLSKDLKESTVPHELLHGVFDMVDSKRRASILEWIQKKLNVDNVQAEEWLADNFSEYYRTGKFWTKWLAKWLVEKVKQFFYQVKSYIDGTYKNEKQIRQLFDDIIDWKIEWEYWVYSDPKFQSVWHGSPADFERFDSTHMWEWEWAQAHGWGHYVAKDKATWEHYADMVDKWWYRSRYKWKTRENIAQETRYDKWPSELNSAYEIVKRMDYDNMSFEEARDAAIKTQQNTIDMHNNLLKYGNYEDYWWSKERLENYVKEENENIKILKSFNEKDFEIWKKNLYEVEIPDPIKKDTPTGSNYFEEDSFVENNAVDKIVKAVKDSWLEVWEREWNWKWIDKMVDSYNTEKWIQAKNMYHILKVVLWSDKAASKFLESLGYDWIHYFWGRDWEAYVIFNDDALQITKHHKY